MKNANRFFLLVVCFLTAIRLAAQKVQLPNGWALTPAGVSVALTSDLPLNIALAPGGMYAAVTNNGNGAQSIDLVDIKQQKVVSTIKINAAWLGLAFSKNYLYASGGNDDIIVRYTYASGKLANNDTLVLGKPWPDNKISPTGLTLDEEHNRLYVVTKEDNALYVCDTKAMKILKRVQLGAEAYTCVLNPVKRELYVSGWGGQKIWIYDTKQDALIDSVTTEDHPTDMAVDAKGKWLYVANANSNSVSVISLASHKVMETLRTALSPTAPTGSTTNSVCLSKDNKTLYIANADNNYLAVFDVSSPGNSHSKGFMPVGWYPTCVRMAGNNILVANGKGMSSMANPYGPDATPSAYKKSVKILQDTSKPPIQYIADMFIGTLSIIQTPNEATLEQYTKQVYGNTPYSKEREETAAGEPGNPIPTKAGETSPIKYVFYVLKENRTYDQVLGDMPSGNGDSDLCIFGKKITPNAHTISDDYVLLDNFYVDAEVSADGHNWSMAAYATDFVEKNWPYNYAGRGGNYDFDGSRPIANPTKGFIWDYCYRAGVSFRNYGEFMDNGYPTLALLKQEKNYCKQYPGWNLSIQDIYREKVFERDFDSLVALNAVPRFNSVYLPNDHTEGASVGSYTPIAYLADNDLALGRLIDHISHSSIWKESAIFVLEDDAQDGPDHVDAHRSVAYVISPYIKRRSVNHAMYSTSGMLRTIELILGLPPMSQYDAAAIPMYSCFTPTADITPYTAQPAQVDINTRNTALNGSAKRSAELDFSKADAIPGNTMNEITWKSVKGELSNVPPPRRSAFVWVSPVKDDDD